MGTGFILLALKRKDCAATYALWGSSFYFLVGRDIFGILKWKEIIGADTAFYLASISWLIFLILLYFGTVYVFTKKIFVGLTYVLLFPVLFLPIFIYFLPSQPALVSAAVAFIIFIPLELVLGILSWFLGISVFRDLPRLFSYWTIGAALFLSSVETAVVAISPTFGKNLIEAVFDAGSIGYLGVISEILLVLAFFSLFLHAIRKKECF